MIKRRPISGKVNLFISRNALTQEVILQKRINNVSEAGARIVEAGSTANKHTVTLFARLSCKYTGINW